MGIPTELFSQMVHAAEGGAEPLFGLDTRSVQAGLYLIPLLPMLGALFNGLFSSRLGKGSSGLVACASVGASFLLSLLCFGCVYPGEVGRVLYQDLFTWFSVPASTGFPGIHIELAYAVDRLSSVLLLVITGVGLLIHIYSLSYMSEERSINFARYFAYLNLFVGMMLTLVMGANLLVLFVGWEGVGLASYLLIGFWWDDDQKAYAGRKAFVANRIGDFGFLLGIFTLLATLGTVDLYRGTPNAEGEMAMQQPLFQALQQKAAPRVGSIATAHTRVPEGAFKGFEYGSVLTLAALLLFVGACGKSAQIPLFVWLPDAMAGPTPVSALIHAATMVTAGVYMLCRLNYVVADAPDAMLVIAFVGAGTALVAAIIGTMQDDIKKVLAYSTVSQLGFMILGCGVGAFWAGSLHLLTHAFFKACLFLGAGSVMHAMANETNIWKLGGLRKEIPLTHWTFLAATIAITGVLPFSGFFSKDAILDLTKHAHFPGAEWAGVLLYVMGTLAAGCTAYYMFRAYFLTFWGSRRSLPDHHPHEAGLMTFALVILGILSVVGLYWGLPIGHGFSTPWETYLENIFAPGHQALVAQKIIEGEESGLPVAAWGVALVVAWAGAGFAYFKYVMRPLAATDLASERPVGNGLVELVRHKFYVDELYDLVLIRPVKWLALNLWKVVDQLLIDKVLVGIWGVIADVTSGALRSFQNGSAQRYVAVMAISLAVILLLSPARAFFTHLFGH